jgi:hypothetical protein
MAISANAQIEFEAGQTLVAMAVMTDSGDHQTYTGTAGPWSNNGAFAPVVYPNGLATGGAVVPAISGTNDKVDVSALTVYLAGVLTSVAEDTDVTISRGADADTHRITSITVAGVDGGSFTETRGGNGGPTLIAVDHVEVAQVRTTSVTAAAITADEIYAVRGQHSEWYDFPVVSVDPLAGTVTMSSALPLSHTGAVTKRTYAQVYTPLFLAVTKALDFVPAESSYSVNSTEYYGGVIGGSSESLAQAKFTALLENGHTDYLIGMRGQNLLFRFKQDRNKTPYSLTQGILGVSRTFPKANQVQAACTISAENPTVDFTG